MIFISYVRDDTGGDGSARRVRDAFAAAVGDSSVFFDEASIGPGTAWSSSIEDGLERASALVLVLGPRWRDVTLPKLEAEGEVVRREVLTVHGSGRPVIPVIVDDAIPRTVDSPGFPLLAELQWAAVTDSRSEEQFERLVDRVLDVIVREDLIRLLRPPSDRVVSGLDELLRMSDARRRAVARILAADRAQDVEARRAAALTRLVLDPTASERAAPDRVGGITGLLLDLHGIRLLEVGTPALRPLRTSTRQLLAATDRTTDVLDRCLLLALDAALDRAVWIADRSGSGRPTSLEQARSLLGTQKGHLRARTERVAAHVFGSVITVSEPTLATSLATLRPWPTPRVRQPDTSGRRAPARRGRRPR